MRCRSAGNMSTNVYESFTALPCVLTKP